MKKVWENRFIKNKTAIIYNGAEKNYIPRNFTKDEKPTLISVEGNICSAFNSINLIKCLNDYEYEIYGEIDDPDYLENYLTLKTFKIKGVVKRDIIKNVLKK